MCRRAALVRHQRSKCSLEGSFANPAKGALPNQDKHGERRLWARSETNRQRHTQSNIPSKHNELPSVAIAESGSPNRETCWSVPVRVSGCSTLATHVFHRRLGKFSAAGQFRFAFIRFSGKSRQSGKDEVIRMTWAIRSCALAAGAAALLSAQAVYAAPAQMPVSSVDPLVSLSILGTQQSRAAVCAASTACNVPASMASASAATAAASATAAQAEGTPKRFSPLLLGLGVAAFIALLVAITSGGHNGNGNLNPVSPA